MLKVAVNRFLKLCATKNKTIEEVYGIFLGEQAQINMVMLYTIVCTDTCGLMVLRNV